MERPYYDVVWRSVCDAVRGVCAADLIRIVARDGTQGIWGMGLEDAAAAHTNSIIHDWLSSTPDSLFDIMELHIREIMYDAPQPVVGIHERTKLEKLLGSPTATW